MPHNHVLDAQTEPPPVLAERVRRLIEAQAAPDRAPALQAFAAAYLHRVPEDSAEPEALYHEVAGAFELVASRRGRPAAVRAFTPTMAECGYETGGSIVETNTDDLPYLVDSVSAAIGARGLGVRRVMHPIVGTDRDHDGTLRAIVAPRDAIRRESVMHFELDRRLEEKELAELATALEGVLTDVRRCVGDFPAMTQSVGRMIEYARQGAGRYAFDEVNETTSFLRWLLEGNFTFLGYREYEASGDALSVVPGTGLGLLAESTASSVAKPRSISELRPAVQERIRHGDLLLVTKTNRLSPVRRRTRMDYIAVRWIKEDGETIGEARLLGLFTEKAYAAPATETPLLNGKLRRILDDLDLIEGSHDHRAAVEIFSSFPKDELFAAAADDLRRAITSLLALQADEVRLLGRVSPDGRSVSLLVALPAERYSPRLIERLERLFAERFDTPHIETHLVLAERGQHARLHFVVHSPGGDLPDVDLRELQRDVRRHTRTWDDAVVDALAERHGVAEARNLIACWGPRFPEFYKVATQPVLAAHDIENLERLEGGKEPFVVGLQNADGKSGPMTRLTLYKRGGKVPLSDFLPNLEMLGLRVIDERPTRLQHGTGDTFVQNFGVLAPDGTPLDLAEAGERLADAIGAVHRGVGESDWLNKLVILAGLSWRQVGVLRAYRVYRQRLGARFGLKYDSEAFGAQPHIARKLVAYFELRFDPSQERDPDAETALRDEILRDLDAVTSLDQDRILRDQLSLIDATLRTNAFKPGRDALALKIRSADVPGMPGVPPYVEVFVHSTEMEGIHLRGGPVARGGLRWSDRLDFRTEVYGLMRAQMTKNAVIVPTGAKGGFYLKRRPSDPTALREEVRRQYTRFIRSLLDLADNLVSGEVVHPEGVRIMDGEDPYFVVAADKGTATFSDTANAIAVERGFWLGDAFASGGSVGYDHKGLGITARGAWESVKRHFRELGLDPERDVITAVGIGDMSGDVFGNGMLLSKTIKLKAAYDHRHVFLDPDPDPATSWEERRRLFDLPGSSWADYAPECISEGGGVFPRTAKTIPLTPQMRTMLGITDEALAPDEVIRAILRAPVDLLYNGGIGTVVKASTESDADARDRASDSIRVDARDLRCSVIGEGGNLGLTQRARIEFAAAGGRVNADFIDNAAGVDCSDHEVNLKILLDMGVARGELTVDERNALLKEVTEDVVAHVLGDSSRQARILSREVDASAGRMYAYEDLLDALDAEGILDREGDALPGSQELAQRRRAGQGLHRPELAVLVAHSKRSLTEALLESELIDDPWVARDLRGYFPHEVVHRFGKLIDDHRLRRRLAATLVANEVVDALGPSFVSRLSTELGTPPAEVVRAYRIAREVTAAPARWAAIDALDAGLDRTVEAELAFGVERLVEDATRWCLSHAPPGPLEPLITRYRDGFARIEAALHSEPPPGVAEYVAGLAANGIPEDVALEHALAAELTQALDVVAVAQGSGRDVHEVGAGFTLLAERLRLGWIEEALDRLPAEQRVERWALQALRDDVRGARRELVAVALGSVEGDDAATAHEAVELFLEARSARVEHIDRLLAAMEVSGPDLAGLMVIERELRSLSAR